MHAAQCPLPFIERYAALCDSWIKTARAKLVLAKLEAEDRASPRDFDELPLFAATPRPTSPHAGAAAADSIIAALAALNPDEMSPREALEALYALKVKAAEDR